MFTLRTKMLGGIIIAMVFSFGIYTPPIAEAQFQGTNGQPPGAPSSIFDNTGNNEVEASNAFGLTGLRLSIFNLLSSLGAFIAWIGGSLFDISVSLFTVGLVNTIEYLNLDKSIESMWAIVRDLFNLLFIFGLIFAGFKMILDANDSGSKKTIGSIIVAALLINFSLFAAQIIVDFSTVAAYQIDKLIVAEEDFTLFGVKVGSHSGAFTQIANIDSLGENADLLAKEAGLKNAEKDTWTQAFLLGFLFMLFYTILGFVLAAGAVILFTRFFALVFIMIFSPIMFIGFIFPKLQKYSSQWWGYFLNQALIGPAFLFMLYLTLRALMGMQDLKEPGVMSHIIYLLIVTAFLWASLLVAKSLGAYGGAQAVSIGQNWGRGIRGGVTGFVARNSVGRAGDAYDRRLEERGVRDNTWRRRLASSLAGNKFGSSQSRADARGSEEKASIKRARYNQIHGESGITAAINAAHASVKDTEKQIKMERAITGASNEQIIEMLAKNKHDSAEYENIVAHMSAGQFDSVMKAKPDELDDDVKSKIAEARSSYIKTAVKDSGGIRNASEAQLKVLGVTEIKDNAADLKQSQFDDIMKSKDYTETEKGTIKNARETALGKRFASKPESVFVDNKGTRKKDGEIAKLPSTILVDANAAEYISGGAMKKMMDDDTLSQEDRKKIKTNIRLYGVNESANEFLKTPQGKIF